MQGSPAKNFTMSTASEMPESAGTAEALPEAAGSEATEAPSPAETATSCAGTPASGVVPLDKAETGPGLPAENLCSTCRKLVSETNAVVVARAVGKTSNSLRCKACHNLKSRINRLLSHYGSLAEDWTKVTENERKEFYQKYKELAGSDLLTRLQETVTESKRTNSAVSFEGTGDFLDEIDLEEKYKNKPDQLTAIKANTRTYFCPIRQVQLFEDVKYKRRAVETEEYTKVQKRKTQSIPLEQGEPGTAADSSQCKKGKKEAAKIELPKLKAGGKKKIFKKLELMNTKKLQLMDWNCKARGEKVKDLVPAYVVNASTKLVDDAVAFGVECDSILESGHADADEVIKKADCFTEQLTEMMGRVKYQVDQAHAFAATSASGQE